MLSQMPGNRFGNILVTGATGFLGSHFVREWLRTESGHVFALARSKGTLTGASRLIEALKAACFASGTRNQISIESLMTIDGDVTQPLAGVVPESIANLCKAGVDVFWHFASDLRYEDRNREETRRINVDGALYALTLAAAIGVKRFVYVSTAFVCGRQSGLIEETLAPLNQEFSNGYEVSKAEAEHRLVAECELLRLPLTILRPSIVIGPRATQSAHGSNTGLFSLIHALMWVRSSQAGQIANVRMPACPDAEINFIPIDCVVEDMLTLAKSGFGTKLIYHLTSSSSVSVKQCFRAISEVVGIKNVVLLPADSFEPSRAEQLIARRIRFFLSYISVDRRFTRSLSPDWTLDATDFTGYVLKGRTRIESSAREISGHAG